jgi:ketosteroid isomerase-like protein
MTHELEQKVIDIFKAFDSLDYPNIFPHLSDEIAGVDELSQKWFRGRAAVEANFRSFEGVVTEIHSDLTDISVMATGDMAIVTCLLNQRYMYEGNPVEIVAPTTCALRLENGQWKFVLLHSVPFA